MQNKKWIRFRPDAVQRFLGALASILFFLSACDQAPPSPTPTRFVSGPTLEPSAIVLPLIPTSAPFEPGQDDLTAASLPRDSELPPLAQGTRAPGALSESIVITLANGDQHPGDLYAPAGSGITPGVLLLAADAAEWGTLPSSLRDAGITTLVTSVPPTGTIADFDVLLTSLGETSDPGHLAVAGIGASAAAALSGCAADALCDAAAVIRPSSSSLVGVMSSFNPRPLFAAARADDAEGTALAQALIDGTAGAKQLYPLADDSLDFAAVQALVAWLSAQLG